jgi:hypothetical protein
MTSCSRRAALWSLTIPLCLAAGCRDDGGGAQDSDTDTDAQDGSGSASDTGDDTAAAEITYWQDVAPILYESCVGCHRSGGVAPFALDDYASAKEWAPASAAAVQGRTMPPWLVTADGSCGEFRDSRWLDPADVDTIAAWAEAGAPEGMVRDDLVAAEPEVLEEGMDVSTPDFLPEIEGGPLSQYDEYRCFLVDPALAQDVFLTGYSVEPGNEAIVHHVLLMPVDPALEVEPGVTNLDVMQALDDESPDRDGWSCFGAAGDGVEVQGIPVAWAPGQGVVDYPEGTGVRVRAGERFVVQVHYNLADAAHVGESARSTVRLRLEDQVEREGFFLLPDALLDTLFEEEPYALPAGQASVEYTWELPADDILAGFGLPSVDVYGVFPHMHAYGRRMHASIERDGAQEQCMAEVPRWDFGWQLYYFYEEPVSFASGDRLRVTCDYDTRAATEPVLPGWGTYNEMCLLGVFLVPPQ